ncbi:unnamed protein product [Pylaiella littoralis]
MELWEIGDSNVIEGSCGFSAALAACAIHHGMNPDAVHTALTSCPEEVGNLIERCHEAVVTVFDLDHSAGSGHGMDGGFWVFEGLEEMDTSWESVFEGGNILTPAQWVEVLRRGGWADDRAIRVMGELLGFPEIQIVKEIFKTGKKRGKPRELVDFFTPFWSRG